MNHLFLETVYCGAQGLLLGIFPYAIIVQFFSDIFTGFLADVTTAVAKTAASYQACLVATR